MSAWFEIKLSYLWNTRQKWLFPFGSLFDSSRFKKKMKVDVMGFFFYKPVPPNRLNHFFLTFVIYRWLQFWITVYLRKNRIVILMCRRVTLHGSHCGCGPPLLCWHGTSNRLPVKLSVGTADPGGTQQRALLKIHRSPCWFCSWKTQCLHVLGHVVGVKEGELKERVEEEDLEKYMLHIMLLIPF